MAKSTPGKSEPQSRAKAQGGKRLLWEVYQTDFDAGMWALIGGGGVAILLLGGFAGAAGANGGIATAVLGALLAGITGLAAGAIGAFVGFLFGLPRTLTSNELRGARATASEDASARAAAENPAEGGVAPDSAPAAPASETAPSGTVRSSYTDVNTNLEQISDWLTKIIVGVGLTQLNSIPGEIDAFGERVDVYFLAGGKALGIGTGIYCLIVGFFLAYVGTRVRLSLIFTASQRNNNQTGDGIDLVGGSANSMFLAAASASPGEGAGDSTLRKADEAVLSKSQFELRTIDQWRARANALARSDEHEEARKLYEEILKRVPATAVLLWDYAQILGLTGRPDKAKEALASASLLADSPDEKREAERKVGEAELRGEILGGLYGRDGKDFKDSIAKLEELKKRPGKDRDLWVHIWSACAHGQRYAATKQEKDREKVVDEVRIALSIEPKRKGYLAALYDPKLVRNGEDDLTSLYPDEALNGLLLENDLPTA